MHCASRESGYLPQQAETAEQLSGRLPALLLDCWQLPLWVERSPNRRQ